jgi:hypothetical protein
VIGEDPDGLVIYNRALLDLARHYGFQPRACRPYRPKTKGKVERPFRYIREDFFLGASFRNLDDLNIQLRHWLDTVANPRLHATTQCVVNEAFAKEKPALKPLPLVPYHTVLKLERRLSYEGMVSVSGNLYSVPDTTRRRVLDVHVFADEIRIFEDGALIATHAPLEGRNQKHLDPTHRACRLSKPDAASTSPHSAISSARSPKPSVRAPCARRSGCRFSLLIVDEIGYLPVVAGGGNLFFQLVNARYEKGAMILTSNRGFAEWGEVFGDPVVATALLDRLLHHAIVIQIEGSSYRLRQHAVRSLGCSDPVRRMLRSEIMPEMPVLVLRHRRRTTPVTCAWRRTIFVSLLISTITHYPRSQQNRDRALLAFTQILCKSTATFPVFEMLDDPLLKTLSKALLQGYSHETRPLDKSQKGQTVHTRRMGWLLGAT